MSSKISSTTSANFAEFPKAPSIDGIGGLRGRLRRARGWFKRQSPHPKGTPPSVASSPILLPKLDNSTMPSYNLEPQLPTPPSTPIRSAFTRTPPRSQPIRASTTPPTPTSRTAPRADPSSFGIDLLGAARRIEELEAAAARLKKAASKRAAMARSIITNTVFPRAIRWTEQLESETIQVESLRQRLGKEWAAHEQKKEWLDIEENRCWDLEEKLLDLKEELERERTERLELGARIRVLGPQLSLDDPAALREAFNALSCDQTCCSQFKDAVGLMIYHLLGAQSNGSISPSDGDYVDNRCSDNEEADSNNYDSFSTLEGKQPIHHNLAPLCALPSPDSDLYMEDVMPVSMEFSSSLESFSVCTPSDQDTLDDEDF